MKSDENVLIKKTISGILMGLEALVLEMLNFINLIFPYFLTAGVITLSNTGL